MIKSLMVFGVSLLFFQVSLAISIYDTKLEKKPKFQYTQDQQQGYGVFNDSKLVGAVNQEKNVDYLEAGNLVVDKLLPDDVSGRPHQKIMIRLSNGRKVQIVSNLEFCEKIPVQVGERITVGGQFVWTRNGGLVHWVHSDPKGQRKDGYVIYNNKSYCR